MRVYVAQGETNTVIPRELLDRTWRYLVADAEASATARRAAGGHAITADTVTGLGDWIAELLRVAPTAAG